LRELFVTLPKRKQNEESMSMNERQMAVIRLSFETRMLSQAPFGPETQAKITQLRAVYGLELTAADAHRLDEAR
jgi:hypothetical protein